MPSRLILCNRDVSTFSAPRSAQCIYIMIIAETWETLHNRQRGGHGDDVDDHVG